MHNRIRRGNSKGGCGGVKGVESSHKDNSSHCNPARGIRNMKRDHQSQKKKRVEEASRDKHEMKVEMGEDRIGG